MEQFNLDKWLENPSLKVVTKTGEEVKIIDTNAPDENNPIVGYIYHKQKWNGPWSWHIDGIYKVGGDDMDLFFADEEEEFTEFEKELKAMIQDIERGDFTDESFDFWKDRLLDLVRKELQQEFDKEMDKMLTETDKYNRDSIIALIQWSESFNSSGMTHDKANQLITWVNSYNPYDIWCHKDSKTFNPTQRKLQVLC